METQTTTPGTSADRASSAATQAKTATEDVAGTAAHEAKQVTREATDQVRQLWGQTRADLTDQAATQQTRVASSLRELADQLGSMADGAQDDGMARNLVEDAARRAGDAAAWLDQRDPGSLLDEARSFAQRRPGTFLAVAAGIGVLAGRLSRGLVDEARDSGEQTGSGYGATSAGDGISGNTGYASSGYGTTAGGYGTGSLGAGAGDGGAGMPTATSPTASTTGSIPVTPGAAPATVGEGAATVPGSQLGDAHRTSQPIAPDGTPTPIDPQGTLLAGTDDDAGLRGDR